MLAAALTVLALATAPPDCSELRPTRAAAYAAVVQRPLRAYRSPGRIPFVRFRLHNVNGVPTVFAVRGCRRGWVEVQLPVRPNGATGWVRTRDLALVKVPARIVVDLSAREVVLYRGGREVFRTRAAIGSPATPTPTGSYYVNQKLIPADAPRGPYGAGALGISAYSPVLKHWAQGGPVAIHGTNQPWLIGRRISNGCIRVTNAALRRLWRASPAGTPVLIRA